MIVRDSFLALVVAGALTLFACSSGDDDDKRTALATGTAPGTAAPGCTSGAVTCANGTLTACEDGTTKTVSCSEQCTADGFEPGTSCRDGSRCACGKTTDPTCTAGIDATCSCLDSSPGCQGTAILDNYVRCHRDPSSETATLLACFARYKSGDQVACNSAILACGNSSPSNGCTADVDCGHCERCERSTGKCLSRLACK
jgi:hypothetical protein